MRTLVSDYKKKKHQIKRRLRDFQKLGKTSDKKIFSELCFCLLTPQSKAVNCAEAIKRLESSNLLFCGCPRSIAKTLKGLARFHNKKASYIVAARRTFSNGEGLKIKHKINSADALQVREWLVKNIKGLGYKEASHFLRNMGFGKDIAILDVHIMKNLRRWGLMNEVSPSMTRRRYLEFEDKFRRLSSKIGISVEELDLLLWSRETGFIFK